MTHHHREPDAELAMQTQEILFTSESVVNVLRWLWKAGCAISGGETKVKRLPGACALVDAGHLNSTNIYLQSGVCLVSFCANSQNGPRAPLNLALKT